MPTMAEAGQPGYVVHHWNALYGPAGAPPAIIRRINEFMCRAMATEPVRQQVEQNGMEVAPSSPEELARFQLSEFDRGARR